MASSRQRLINASSFLSNQKEQIGGLNFKKSTISGAAFKKGTSQESLGEVGGTESSIGKLSRILRDTRGKTLVNEKKITLLKKVGNLRKDNQQVNSPLLESLQAIAATTDSIRDTLIQQQDNDKSVAESMRREKEEKERKDQEKGLEAPKPLQKIADKVIAPVMSVWGRIWKFISTIFLGKILMNFLDWFGNPENQGKITTLVRFVKDWWPALVGAVLLFGTGFGGLVTGLTVAIATWIPKMLGAIKLLKASKLAGLGGKAGLLKGGLLVGGGVLVGMGISKMMGNGEDVSNEKVQGLNKGGKVRGQGDKDTVPAMLTPGEFVMSKGAVQQYGIDTMESMNAAAGGTNRPTMGRYNEGGFIEEKIAQAQQVSSDVANAEAGRELDPLVNLAMDLMKESYGITNTKAGSVSDGAGGFRIQTQDELNEENNAKLPFGMKMTADGNNIDWGRKAADQARMAGEMMKDPRYAEQLKERGKQFGFDNLTPDKFQEIANQQADEMQFQINRMIPGTESHRLDVAANEINQSTAQFAGGGIVQGFWGGGRVKTQEEVQAYFDSQPNAQIQALIREKNEIERDPDGKIRGADRKKYNQLTKQIAGKRAEYKKMLMKKNKISTTSTQTKEKKKGGGWFGGLFGGGKKEEGNSTNKKINPSQKSTYYHPEGSNIKGYMSFKNFSYSTNKKTTTPVPVKEKGSSSGILGPISSNVDAMVNTDKYEVKPKEKQNVVVAYEQEVNNNQQQQETPPAGGNDIPSFDVRPPFMTDQDKMMVLGMRV